ncbi:von Willebrand factor A domain-containing protein 5A isoform X2 [Kryptolebias marmoratus]|uniref:von Willebrand factor A domain-containing protein 5A isoform X2 n=1 Tax=Kryptolebias marmoratus TaxID=37003 RepID=UPI0007F91A48|nr:von Willebrand factor A domain-containing protein 5A isoform X2 [Kryptolebias marmoratus]
MSAVCSAPSRHVNVPSVMCGIDSSSRMSAACYSPPNLMAEEPLSLPLELHSDQKMKKAKSRSSGQRESPAVPQLQRDPLLQLVSLQKASGCWLLDAHLAAVLGKSSEEVEKSKPAAGNKDVYATILALIWLHGFKLDASEEWELLAGKAASWLHAQNAPCVPECVEAGNALLGCSVKKETLGL